MASTSENINTTDRTCPFCSKLFSSSSNVRKHAKKFHNEDLERKNASRIQCPLCEENIKSFEKLNQHLKDQHGLDTEIVSLHFANFEECSRWMELEKIKANYAVSNTKKTSEYEAITYECNRNNLKKYKSTCVKRTEKAGGSIKIKGYCPSRVIIKILKSGVVRVQFCKTHVGHTFEIRTQKLTKEEENVIVEKLKCEETLDDVTKYKTIAKAWLNNMEQFIMNTDIEKGLRVMQQCTEVIKKYENEEIPTKRKMVKQEYFPSKKKKT